MAKGYGLVKQAAEESEARRTQAGSFVYELRSKDIREAGGEVVVRFLEQGNEGPDAVNVYPRHEYKIPDNRAKSGYFTNFFTCLKEGNPNADCPGCKAGLPTKPHMVYNLIQRGRPIYRKDKDNKPIVDSSGNKILEGNMDEVVYWRCASTTGDMMSRKDNDYHGLMSRDFKLQWTGTSFQPYELVPFDVDGGPQPMSDNDRSLAARKHDLDKIYAPPTFQEAARIVNQYGANSGATQHHVPVATHQPNAFQASGVGAVAPPPPPPPPVGAGAFSAAQQPPTQQ